jgi:autotransporter-associated beta strand protein
MNTNTLPARPACLYSIRTIKTLAALALCASLASVHDAQATNGTWTNVNGGTWSTTTNWQDDIVAGGAGAEFDFRLNISENRIISLDQDVTLGSLVGGATNSAHTITLNATGGDRTLTLSTGTADQPLVDVPYADATVTWSGSSLAVSGTGGFIKDGSGRLSVSGVTLSGLSGQIWVKEGTLLATDTNPLGSTTIRLGDGTSQGTLRNSGAYLSLTNNIELSAGNQTMAWRDTQSVGSAGILGTITGSGGLRLLPTSDTVGGITRSVGIGNSSSNYSGGTWISAEAGKRFIAALRNSSTIDGNGTVTAGPLGTGTVYLDGGGLAVVGASRTLHNDIVVQADSVLSGGRNETQAARNLTLAGAMTLSGNRVLTIAIRQADQFVRIDGAIGDGGNGYGLTFRSGGSAAATDLVILDGANTYTGATVVESGVVRLLNNASLASSQITVDGTLDLSQRTSGWAVGASQTLGGSGVVTGNLTVAGTLAPGNSIGALTVANLTLLDGANLVFELTSNATAGQTYDQIIGTSLILPTEGTINLTLAGFGSQTIAEGDSFTLFTGGVTNFDPAIFNIINQTAWTGGWEISEGSLLVTAIPEPSTYALPVLVAVLAYVLRRRRRGPESST